MLMNAKKLAVFALSVAGKLWEFR